MYHKYIRDKENATKSKYFLIKKVPIARYWVVFFQISYKQTRHNFYLRRGKLKNIGKFDLSQINFSLIWHKICLFIFESVQNQRVSAVNTLNTLSDFVMLSLPG